jgi:hypothetical protein
MLFSCSSFARLLLLVFLVVLPCSGNSQPPTNTSVSSSQRVPMHHLYWHFLMYQNHLDVEASQMEKGGQSGKTVRSLIQAKMNMSDDRFAPIHQAAADLSASIGELNARAEKLRAKLIETNPSKEIPLTPEQEKLRSALQMLNDERETLLLREMNKLDNELSTEDRATFRQFMLHAIAPNVRTITHSESSPPPKPNAASVSGGSR